MFSGSVFQMEEEAAGKAELSLIVKFVRINAVHKCMKKNNKTTERQTKGQNY